MEENEHSTDGFVELDGVRLYYEMAGAGEPLILLHGGLMDRRMWDRQFRSLARHQQVIRYDVRRAGKSEASFCSADLQHEWIPGWVAQEWVSASGLRMCSGRPAA